MSFYRGTPVDDFDPRCPWKSLRTKLEPIIDPAHREPEPDQQELQRRRWITSVHESAHTGAFFSVGDGLRGAEVGDRVRDRRYSGTCRTARGGSSDADLIMALLAGEAAELAFFTIDHGPFQYPWIRDANGELPKMSTDRCDGFLAAARMSNDDDEIMRLVERGWESALQFVRQHEDTIRSFAAWLDRAGELSGIACEGYWNRACPNFRNAPGAPTARTAPPAPVQHVVVYAVGREPAYRRVDGWI
jgi:hypothetical protein